MDLEKISEAVGKTVSEKFADFEKAFTPVVEKTALETAKKVAEQMLIDKFVRGYDRTGLSDEQKKDFAAQVISVFSGDRAKSFRVLETKKGGIIDGVTTKANESLIEEQDNRGGYLVSTEVAAAIMRIAASVGTIMKQCQQWSMKTDEMGIPNYTGSFLTGAYLGVDLPGPVTGVAFGQSVLIVRKWQLAFTVGNDLLADASVELGDWLLAMAGEALANMIDQQGFIGSTGNTANGTSVAGPFTGILAAPNTQTYTLGSGNTNFNDFDPVADASNVVAKVEESILDGCAWYFHRTTWAAIRQKEASTSGIPLLFLSGAGSGLKDEAGGGPIKPAGYMASYPVYTNRWLPVYTAGDAQVSTAFGIFGNLKACAFGNKGDLRVANFQSGFFGNVGSQKEIALADQTGIVYKHRHAFAVVLPQAFVVIKTPAS